MILIILPSAFYFSAKNPHSIESVIRNINSSSKFKEKITVICDEGMDSGNDYRTIKIPPYDNTKQRLEHIFTIIKQHNVQLIEVHQHALLGFKIASNFSHIPVVFYRHNVIIKTGNIITNWYYKRRYAKFSANIFVSKFLVDKFTKVFPSLSKCSYAVANPIEVSDWQIDGIVKENLIVFAGRAIPEKGVDHLAKSLETILEKYPNWHAALAMGNWEDKPEWAAAAIKNLEKFGDRCKIYKNAPLDMVKDLLARGRIAVIPSVWEEPFCLSAIESHAAKCAVISSGTGGMREASGTNALYLEAVTPQKITDAITMLIDDKVMQDNLAQSGYEFVVKHHNVLARAKELDEIRESINANLDSL